MGSKNIELLQVAGMSVGPVIALERMLVRFDFLAPDECGEALIQKGPSFALTPDQVRELIQLAARTLQVLESAQMPSPGEGPSQ